MSILLSLWLAFLNVLYWIHMHDPISSVDFVICVIECYFFFELFTFCSAFLGVHEIQMMWCSDCPFLLMIVCIHSSPEFSSTYSCMFVQCRASLPCYNCSHLIFSWLETICEISGLITRSERKRLSRHRICYPATPCDTSFSRNCFSCMRPLDVKLIPYVVFMQ